MHFFILPSSVLRPAVSVDVVLILEALLIHRAKPNHLLKDGTSCAPLMLVYCGKTSLWAMSAAPLSALLPFILLLSPKAASPALAPFIP